MPEDVIDEEEARNEAGQIVIINQKEQSDVEQEFGDWRYFQGYREAKFDFEELVPTVEVLQNRQAEGNRQNLENTADYIIIIKKSCVSKRIIDPPKI